MLGVIINVITVIIGSSIGLLFKKGIPERVSSAAMTGLGACTMYIGITGSLSGENVLILIASVVLGAWSLWQKLTGQALEGFTTVILLQLIIGSILMLCLGIIGYYIAKIYEEIKDRPRYILSRDCGGEDDDAEETP